MRSMFWKTKISWLAAAVSLALVASGCSSTSHRTTAKPAVATPKPIVTPDFSLSARVVSVNTIGRFVVLSFPAGQMPRLDQTLFLYRDGLKTAEVHVTGPQMDSNIVADLVSGDAQVGDTVSDK
jgi:hypothetical protein